LFKHGLALFELVLPNPLLYWKALAGQRWIVPAPCRANFLILLNIFGHPCPSHQSFQAQAKRIAAEILRLDAERRQREAARGEVVQRWAAKKIAA
jgi:hypothetical protein